jgi:putative transposase
MALASCSPEARKPRDKEDGHVKEAELFQQIGRLQMELEWLKKSLSCSDACELRKLVDHVSDDNLVEGSRQSG